MLKKINRVLRLFGLKLIRPRRYAPKSEAQRVQEFVEEFNGPKVPLSDYMGEYEWQNTPTVPNPGMTHYVGDDCPGGHEDCFKANPELGRVEQPNSDNKITGPTS